MASKLIPLVVSQSILCPLWRDPEGGHVHIYLQRHGFQGCILLNGNDFVSVCLSVGLFFVQLN